jgi:hypothetical protein
VKIGLGGKRFFGLEIQPLQSDLGISRTFVDSVVDKTVEMKFPLQRPAVRFGSGIAPVILYASRCGATQA